MRIYTKAGDSALVDVDDGSKICDVCGTMQPASMRVCVNCIRIKVGA